MIVLLVRKALVMERLARELNVQGDKYSTYLRGNVLNVLATIYQIQKEKIVCKIIVMNSNSLVLMDHVFNVQRILNSLSMTKHIVTQINVMSSNS